MPIIARDDDLRDLIARARDFESGEAIKDLARQLAEEAIELVKEGFEEERDPYGTAWKPITYRDGAILRDRGVMLNSLHIGGFSEGNITIEMGVWYAIVHQEGRTIRPRTAAALHFFIRGEPVFAQEVTIPARPFFPRPDDLPPLWEQGFDEVTDAWFLHVIGRRYFSTSSEGDSGWLPTSS